MTTPNPATAKLPAGVKHVTVTCSNIAALLADGSDSGTQADGYGLNYRCEFTAPVQWEAYPGAGLLDLTKPVQARIIDGVLCDSRGNPGVGLIAPREGWTWRLTIYRQNRKPLFTRPIWVLLDGSAATVELSSVMQASDLPGAPIIVGPPGPISSIGSMTATSLPPGSAPTLTKTGTGTPADPLRIVFGIPAGAKGEPGGSDAAIAEWIRSGPQTRAALGEQTTIDQVDVAALVRDLAPRYTTASFVKTSATAFQFRAHDGASKGVTLAWIKDPTDDFFKLDACSVGIASQPVLATATPARLTGTWNTTTVNYYTSEVGATFALTLSGGADITFRVMRESRGGRFAVSVDGAAPVTVSCWAADVAVAAVTVASGLDPTKEHTVVGTFLGDDPAHPPTSSPSRGYIRADASTGTVSTAIYDAAPTTTVLANVSNKEFAFMITAAGQTHYVPEHSGVPSAFAQTPMEIIIDDAPINFSALATGTRIAVTTGIEVRQRVTGRIAGIDVLDLTSVHAIDAQGHLTYTGRWVALASASISGYPLMLPNADSSSGVFVTGIGSQQTTKSDESTVGFTLDGDTVASGAALSGAHKNVVGAATLHNPRLAMRRGQPHRLTTDQRIFVWHRRSPSAPKMYWSAMDKWPISTGDAYAWGFDLAVADIPGIHAMLTQ